MDASYLDEVLADAKQAIEEEPSRGQEIYNLLHKHLKLLGLPNPACIGLSRAPTSPRMLSYVRNIPLHHVTVPLVVSVVDGKPVYEDFEVILDPFLNVMHTVGGESVWAFDLDTLQTLHVPTYDEASKKSAPCARLSDIEGGLL